MDVWEREDGMRNDWKGRKDGDGGGKGSEWNKSG